MSSAIPSNALLEGIADDKARQSAPGPGGGHLAALAKLARMQRRIVDANLEYAAALADLRLVTGGIEDDGGEAAARRVAQQFLHLPAAR